MSKQQMDAWPTPLWYYSTFWWFWRSNYKEILTSMRENPTFQNSKPKFSSRFATTKISSLPMPTKTWICWLRHWNLHLLGTRWTPHWCQYLCASLRAGSPNFCYQTLLDDLQVDTREPYVQQPYQGRHHLHPPLDPQESKQPLWILLSNDKNPQGQRRNSSCLLRLCKPCPSPWEMARLYNSTRRHQPTFQLQIFLSPWSKN